jgi:hypothetical protein
METWVYVYYIKMDLQEIWHEFTHWIDELAHDSVNWRVVGSSAWLRSTVTHWYIPWL